jgi:hypothetical protein
VDHVRVCRFSISAWAWRILAALGVMAAHEGCSVGGNPPQPASTGASTGSAAGSTAGSASGTASPAMAGEATGATSGGTPASGAATGNSFEDAASGVGSADDATFGSVFDVAAAGTSVGDTAAPSFSSDSSSGVVPPGPPGCSNALGAVWSETESGGCASTWTRQGSTSTFSDAQIAPCKVTATLTISINTKGSVSAYWTASSNGDDCNYIGTVDATCTSASGVYSCSINGASGTWNATIK